MKKQVNAKGFAIQGELGSNSHMAALEMLGDVQIVPCAISADVFHALEEGQVDGAVLPIENSLHGSVAEHYDLLLQSPVSIVGESSMRIQHNLVAAPGVELGEIKTVISHPVALSQCRHFLATLKDVQVTPFYDTAGSVKHLMQEGRRDVAGVAPRLAAKQYGAEILVEGIEDHVENYTRFYRLESSGASLSETPAPNKSTVAFAVEHSPGTLVAALQVIAKVGVNLTKIESRPVPGKPWEYIFYVDLRIASSAMADAALHALQPFCTMVRELGRYYAA